MPTLRFSALCPLPLFLAALIACGGGGAQSPPATAPAPVAQEAQTGGTAPQQRPLSQLVNRQVIVFPVQRLVRAPGSRWAPADFESYLRSLDEELAFALENRGLRSGWTAPPSASRIALRNPALNLSPQGLAFPPGIALRAGDDLREPVGSQIRSLAGLADARFGLIPMELVIGESDGMPRAMLRLALVDVRLARVLWVGETAAASAPAGSSDPGPALAARTAELFTDLIAAPPQS